MGGQFSYPHAVAMVALGVPPGPAWFTPEALRDERARARRQRFDCLAETVRALVELEDVRA